MFQHPPVWGLVFGGLGSGSHVLLGVFTCTLQFDAKERAAFLMGGARERFGEEVGGLLVCRDEGEGDVMLGDLFTNPFNGDDDMFKALGENVVVCEITGGGVIDTKSSGGRLGCFQFFKEGAEMKGLRGGLFDGKEFSVGCVKAHAIVLLRTPADRRAPKRKDPAVV